MKKITVELKDTLLRLLLDRYPRRLCTIDHCSICKELAIDTETLITLLEIFKANDLIDDLTAKHVAISILLNFTAASEFIENGGFQAKQAYAELDITRLQLEVQILQFEAAKISKSHPDASNSFERMLTAAGNIASIAEALFK